MMDILTTLRGAMRDAGAALLAMHPRSASTPLESWQKSDASPVTVADMASQKILAQALKPFGWPILSEETADSPDRLKAHRLWIVDPLDGTIDFIAGTDEYCVMVALVEDGVPVLGCIYLPATDTFYYAQKAMGAYQQIAQAPPTKLHVSTQSHLASARMLGSKNHLLQRELDCAHALGITNIVQRGSAGVKGILIAQGEADVYITTSLQTGEWDTCALDSIVREAGGMVTDMSGKRLVYNKPHPLNENGFVVTNGVLHATIVQELTRPH